MPKHAAFRPSTCEVCPKIAPGISHGRGRPYQIPIFYVHLESRKNKYTDGIEKTAWIVDGQQRLAAIVSYRNNEFALPDPQKAIPGILVPVDSAELPPWAGKKFQELAPDDKDRLLTRELLVVEMEAEQNEVRDLFIRLQAGTPLTAQEKRDAWPGEFTNFVIRHAGKPAHPLSNPKLFFTLFPSSRARRLSVDDGDHYVDGLAEVRKFFAGLTTNGCRATGSCAPVATAVVGDGAAVGNSTCSFSGGGRLSFISSPWP